MAENFYTLLTTIGKAQFANSSALGTKINFKTMKVGDGNGAYYDPTEDQLDLKNTKWSGNVNAVSIDTNNPNWIVIEAMIPSDVGGFTVREYGVFDDAGNMLAVSKCAETYKPVITDGSTKELYMKMILAVSNTENVTLKIDPTIIFAKKADIITVDNKIGDLSNLITTNKTNVVSAINENKSVLLDRVYQTASGSATAITLTIKGTLVTGYPITFIASANNNSSATTINGKKLYKPNTTTAPNLISGKAYTVWYSSTGDSGNGCFFIKASAEGTAVANDVLATKTFSNDNDTGIQGAIPVNGTLNYNMPINGSYTIPSGYTTGGTVSQSITTKSAQTYQPSTSQQTINGGRYLSGDQIIAPVTGNSTVNDVVLGKIFSSANGINLVGQATIQSLGGAQIQTGSITAPSVINPNTTTHIQTSFPANGIIMIDKYGARGCYVLPPIGVLGYWDAGSTSGEHYNNHGSAGIAFNGTDITWYTQSNDIWYTPVTWIAFKF